MNLADRIHKYAAGKWWYAPITLASYWLLGCAGLMLSVSMIVDGRFEDLRRGLRLFAGGGSTITFSDHPVAFILLVLFFAICGLGLFLIGWLKFKRRRRNYLVHAKYL